MRPSLPLVLVALLAGCASSSPVVRQTWLPASPDHWQGTVTSGVTLDMRNGSSRHIPGKVMDTVLTVKARLQDVSGVKAELALVDTEHPNAYATVHGSRPIIALSLSYLEHFGSDQDALAATIGHELAHVHLGHGAAARHADGVALNGVSGSGAASELNSTARDEERHADTLGMKWATAAGYDPCGQARIFRAMAHGTPTLSTHPGFAERIEAADAASKNTTGRSCQ